eukprot:1158454-Pelagomonas_calceolata.AAC.22
MTHAAHFHCKCSHAQATSPALACSLLMHMHCPSSNAPANARLLFAGGAHVKESSLHGKHAAKAQSLTAT